MADHQLLPGQRSIASQSPVSRLRGRLRCGRYLLWRRRWRNWWLSSVHLIHFGLFSFAFLEHSNGGAHGNVHWRRWSRNIRIYLRGEHTIAVQRPCCCWSVVHFVELVAELIVDRLLQARLFVITVWNWNEVESCWLQFSLPFPEIRKVGGI